MILRNARLAGTQTLTDLGVAGDRIVAVSPGDTAPDVIDLGGRAR